MGEDTVSFRRKDRANGGRQRVETIAPRQAAARRGPPPGGAVEQQQWCAAPEARLLPGVPHFLVTLTLPDALRGVCMAHPAIRHDLLLREAAGALKEICRSKLGGAPGFTAVLH